jgi:putative Mg2+ transporter-C (MgtC) family protein
MQRDVTGGRLAAAGPGSGGCIPIGAEAIVGVVVHVTLAAGPAANAEGWLLALVATGAYLIIALAFPLLARQLPRSGTAISLLRVSYPDGRGVLRQVLQVTTARGFAVDELAIDGSGGNGQHLGSGGEHMVEVVLQVHGKGSPNDLAAELPELSGVRAVTSDDVNATAG